MAKILLIKTGDTFAELKACQGDFEDMIKRCLEHTAAQITVYDARKSDPQPNLDDFKGVIITGSHSMVTACEPWSEALLPYIRTMNDKAIPVFGICFGHQLIAKALGGEVGYHPIGPEPGTVDISLTEAGKTDALMGQISTTFKANEGHSQSVLKLPPQATLLAANSFEPHQAFRLGNIWSVQFHPEFTREIAQYYVAETAEEIKKQNLDPEQISEACQDTLESRDLLVKFVEQVCLGELR